MKEHYENFVQFHPDHVRALLAYGGFLRDAGDIAGARAQWEKASQLAPNNPAAWDDLGTHYEEGEGTGRADWLCGRRGDERGVGGA